MPKVPVRHKRGPGLRSTEDGVLSVDTRSWKLYIGDGTSSHAISGYVSPEDIREAVGDNIVQREDLSDVAFTGEYDDLIGAPVVVTGGSQTSTSSEDGGSNVFTFNKSDGTTATLTVKNGTKGSQGPQGPTGPSGSAATISVGTVTTGAEGSSASVTNAGTTSAAVLNFTIPRGATGAKGDTGEKGDKGDPGTNGTNGTSAVWFTGTAVTGTSSVTATVSGSKAGDMYLNSSTWNVYRATAANTWTYVCNIKGTKGDTGAAPTLSAAAGANINATGTPTVTASTSGGTTTFTFNYLKGAKGDPGTNATTTSVVSTSANGLAPKVTDTTKFLKGDGTWAEPTDAKVIQTSDSGTTARAILMRAHGSESSGTAGEAKYNTNVTITPSTSTLNAQRLAINEKRSDYEPMVQFLKDGTAVGSLGIKSSDGKPAHWSADGSTCTNISLEGHTHSGYAVSQAIASNGDLNSITTPGFYNAGGTNTIQNTPVAGKAFGLWVTKNASGTYYSQYYEGYLGSRYVRQNQNGTWGEWTEIKYTDTDINVKQGVSSTASWRNILLGTTSNSAYNTDVASVTGQSYATTGFSFQPSTGTFATNRVVVNPQNSTKQTLFRINKTNTGYAYIHYGGADGSLEGTATGEWDVGRIGEDMSAGFYGTTGDFRISTNGISKNGVTINTEGSLVSTGDIVAKGNVSIGKTLNGTSVSGGANMTYNSSTQAIEFTFN